MHHYYDFKTLASFKIKAELILDHDDSSDYQRQVAQRIDVTLLKCEGHQHFYVKKNHLKKKLKLGLKMQSRNLD